MAPNVVYRETAIRLESGTKRNCQVPAQNVADDPTETWFFLALLSCFRAGAGKRKGHVWFVPIFRLFVVDRHCRAVMLGFSSKLGGSQNSDRTHPEETCGNSGD